MVPKLASFILTLGCHVAVELTHKGPTSHYHTKTLFLTSSLPHIAQPSRSNRPADSAAAYATNPPNPQPRESALRECILNVFLTYPSCILIASERIQSGSDEASTRNMYRDVS